jgi:polyisoprenoid-binding protein YceI
MKISHTSKVLSLASVSGMLASLSLTHAADLYQPGKYAIDPMHSKVGFEVPHLVISTVEGRFDDYQGEIALDKDIKKSVVNVTIQAQSINTGIAKRDEHLKSPDFFEAAKFAQITFKSKKVEGNAQALKVTGDLTIKGVTKEVTLKGKLLGSVKDGYGNQKTAFDFSTQISRKDFGLTWNSAVEAGPVVGDKISISLKVQAALQAQKTAQL